MQFVTNGPDIPLSLLRAHREGGVLFMVGAGISANAGLPLFGRLVDQIYERLGQALPGAADSLATRAEQEARAAGQYDRLAGLLEQRLVFRGAQWRQPNNPVRDAVAALLAPPRRARLTAHQDLIDLARGRDGRPRIVTTNFDTLFERAWSARNHSRIASSAGPAIPPVGSYDFAGILHIHGRVEDSRLRLERTDLVLSSPNFGEAYMRNGWASRVVYDLLRRYSLVLVGYSADDPPMRYMLEATEEGRLNFPDLKPAYALVADEHGDSGGLREAWAGKGLQPLLYSVSGGDFSPLYETLGAWAEMARDPLNWSRAQLGEIGSKAFGDASAPEKEKYRYLAQEISSVLVASEQSPDPAWLETLETAPGQFELNTCVDWFRCRLTSAEAARMAAAMNDGAKAMVARAVELLLQIAQEPLPEPFARFWVLFVQAYTRTEPDRLGRMRQDDATTTTRIRDWVARFEPRLRIDRRFRFSEDESASPPTSIHQIGRFHFRASDRDWRGALDRWPQDTRSEERLILALDRCLIEACELARDAGLVDADGDLMSTDLAMVHAPEPDEGLVERDDRHGRSWRLNQPDAHNDSFAPIVRMLTGLWRRLVGRDPTRATRIARDWAARDDIIFKRIASWAATISDAGPADEIVAYLGTTTRDRFWAADLTIETARFWCLRWNSLPPAVRRRLEGAMLAGYRVEQVRRFTPPGNILYARALYSVRELQRVVTAGGRLSAATAASLQRLLNRHPGLPREMPLLAHLYSPSWSGSGYSADIRALDDVDDDQLIATAAQLEDDNRLDQRDVWRVFCDSEPGRAYQALGNAQKRGEFDPRRWEPLLGLYGYRSRELPEGAAALGDVLTSLLDAPADALVVVRHPLARIIESKASSPNDPLFALILTLWDRLIPELAAVENTERETSLQQAIAGSALAMLAGALITMQSNVARREAGGFDDQLAARFELLAALPGRARIVAKAALMEQLPFLDWLAPDWTQMHLVALLTADSDVAIELISVVARSVAPQYPRIFNTLKSTIFRALEHERVEDGVREYLSGALIGAALAVIGGETDFDLGAVECRRALTRLPGDVLARMAWEIGSNLRDKPGASERAQYWIEVVEPFLVGYWPNDVAARTPEVSKNIAHLPALAGDAFERAVDVVLGLVRPAEQMDLRLGLGLDEGNLLGRFPHAVLRLITAILDSEGPAPYDLEDTIQALLAAEPTIVGEPAFWRLRLLQRPR